MAPDPAREPPPEPGRLTRRSIAWRLALMLGLAVLACFMLLDAALHQVLRHELAREQTEEMQTRLEDVRALLTGSRSPRLAQLVRERLEFLTALNPRARLWMWSADPAWRFGDGAEPLARRFAQAGQNSPGNPIIDWSGGAGELAAPVLGAVLPASDAHPALTLMAGGDNQPFTRTLRIFEGAQRLLTLAGAALTAALGYWIARIGLRPLSRMSADAQSIGPGNRGQRLALAPLPRELLHLGQSFNAALDRFDGARRQMETFNADVAHELRTPLTNLIGQTQVALGRERDAPALREVLQSNLEELERLRAIVADMLFLARAEQGERARARVPASLAAEAGKTIEFFEVLLDEAHMRVTVQGDAQAPIETALFRRALTNLLQNAIQHSPPGAGIDVRITQEPHGATVALSNPGGPIAPEHLARLFDRFYLIDAARRNRGESHGLGLAIVKAVAAMHQGAAFAHSANGRVTIGFSVAA